MRDRKWAPRRQVADEEVLDATISDKDAKKLISENIRAFFGSRDIDKSEGYFTKLPTRHHFRLVDKMVTRAIMSEESDAQLVADMFRRAVEKNLCNVTAFEDGFALVAKVLDEIATDAPEAFELMAMMMSGAGLDADQWWKISEKLVDCSLLLSLF